MPRKGGKSLSPKKKANRASEVMDMAEIPTKDGGQQKGNDSQGAYGDETQGPVKEFMKMISF